ncbi:MAG TPA: aminoglycoside phosphotransferase family protein [Bacteroidales bacterium]|nr:aminoglycoside phosphotransferase family protein [Bacteroidales bacterium]
MQKFSSQDISPIISRFPIRGTFTHAIPLKTGHINDTLLVHVDDRKQPDYVLQRINTHIFRNVDQLMENIWNVTSHLQKKMSNDDYTGEKLGTLELVKTTDDRLYCTDAEGGCWRCFIYCRNNVGASAHITTAIAAEGGRALGLFQSMLADLPALRLHQTIPDFHDLPSRLLQFETAMQKDPQKRSLVTVLEIEAIRSRADGMLLVYRLAEEGKIPLRITHNDTKINNILFDDQEKALCLVDLDTVMPGYVHFDFGDAIRTLASTATEDDPEIENIAVDLNLYESFAQGYLKVMKDVLTPTEIETLAYSARLMTYIMAVRFFTDYLLGDTYYKTNYPDHNLVRTRNQLALLQAMEAASDKMESIIREIVD